MTVPVPKAYIKIADLFTGGLVLTVSRCPFACVFTQADSKRSQVDAVAGLELKTSGQVTLGKSRRIRRGQAGLPLVRYRHGPLRGQV